MKDTNLNYTLNVIGRWAVGLVFLFSSLTKGVDPLGTTYKVEEYMTAWTLGDLAFTWALPLAGVLAVTLICAEFLIGMLLVTNAFRRLSAWGLALMMVFFTVTTLIDAITNKVTDCGCFGDAIPLTNWQTFWKNVALDVPTVWIVLTRDLRRKRRFERDLTVSLSAIAVMIIFALYNIKHEPLVDFRPWKVGNRMIDEHEGQEIKSYVTYRSLATGEEVEMESSALMARYQAEPDFDERWEWVSSRVDNPLEVKADGFSMMDREGEDRAGDLLKAPDGLVIVTVHHLDEVDERGVREVMRALRLAEENGTKIVMLTSALEEEVQAWLYENNIIGLDYLFADATAIKAMMRGNPGFMQVQDATVVAKGRKADDLEW